MNVDGVDAKFWIDVLQWITTIGVGIYVWQSNRHRATREHITAVEKDLRSSIETERVGTADRLNNHAHRLTAVEEGFKHLPASHDFKELAHAISALHGDFQRITGQFEGFKELAAILRERVGRIDDFLREHGK